MSIARERDDRDRQIGRDTGIEIEIWTYNERESYSKDPKQKSKFRSKVKIVTLNPKYFHLYLYNSFIYACSTPEGSIQKY